LFDIKNSQQIQAGLEKPILVELGPYVYSEKREKRNIKFPNKSQIQFTPVSTLFFEPDLSNGTENDSITFLNLPIIVRNCEVRC